MGIINQCDSYTVFSVQMAYSISAHRYLCIHKKSYALEMNGLMSQSNPTFGTTSGCNGNRDNAIVNVVHPTIGRPQMVDCNTITEINSNSRKWLGDQPPPYLTLHAGQSSSSQSI